MTFSAAGTIGSHATVAQHRAKWGHVARTASRTSAAIRVDERRQTTRLSAGLHLKTVCRLFQIASADSVAADCVVDDDGVPLQSEAVCRVLGLVVGELISNAKSCVPVATLPQPISIVLRQRGAVLLCVFESDWLTESGSCVPSGLPCTERMVLALGSSCVVRLMPDRALTAILLDTEVAEQRIPAAVAAYRAARATRGPVAS